jgi:hypothetical protein
MDRITIEPFVLDQQRIRFWGAVCGYCGTRPGMPVNFLAGPMCSLNEDEKADVIEAVMEAVGGVSRTPQTRKAFDVIESRRHIRQQRQAGKESTVS